MPRKKPQDDSIWNRRIVYILGISLIVLVLFLSFLRINLFLMSLSNNKPCTPTDHYIYIHDNDINNFTLRFSEDFHMNYTYIGEIPTEDFTNETVIIEGASANYESELTTNVFLTSFIMFDGYIYNISVQTGDQSGEELKTTFRFYLYESYYDSYYDIIYPDNSSRITLGDLEDVDEYSDVTFILPEPIKINSTDRTYNYTWFFGVEDVGNEGSINLNMTSLEGYETISGHFFSNGWEFTSHDLISSIGMLNYGNQSVEITEYYLPFNLTTMEIFLIGSNDFTSAEIMSLFGSGEAEGSILSIDITYLDNNGIDNGAQIEYLFGDSMKGLIFYMIMFDIGIEPNLGIDPDEDSLNNEIQIPLILFEQSDLINSNGGLFEILGFEVCRTIEEGTVLYNFDFYLLAGDTILTVSGEFE